MISMDSQWYTGLHAGAAEAQAPSRAPMVRLLRSHMKTILSNPESRKIFYFLMLNMVYMLVQIVYGVWTNSLGLISDGALARSRRFTGI